MTTLSAADLPLLGTKGAPKKFTGKYSDVDRFLYHYNRLCLKYNVTDDQEKIDNITQYCSRKVREVLEGIPAFTGNHWDDFSDNIRKYFEADKEAKRYRINDIEVYVQQSKQKSLKSLEHWNKYNRGFIRIVGWLKQEQRLTDREANFYFWKGIPRRFRQQLEPRIIIKNPMHNTKDPFTIRMVCNAAESLLSRDRFDNERLPSDSEEETSGASSSDSDSDDEDKGSEGEHLPRSTRTKPKRTTSDTSKKTHHKHKEPAKNVSFREPPEVISSESDNDKPSASQRQQARGHKSAKSTTSAADQEVEDLISQLNSMNVDDPAYATTYFRACSKNPLVKDIIPSPVVQRKSTALGSANRPFERQAPPHMDNSMRRDIRKCFGCGNLGHGMSSCSQLLELLNQGAITRDNLGRYVMKNGEPIRKNSFDEPLAQAVKRAIGATSNFIGIPSSSDESDGDVYWGHEAHVQDYWSDDEDDIAPYVYDVEERPKRSIRTTRKAKESSWVPHRKESGVRDKSKPGRPTPKRVPTDRASPEHEQVPFNTVPLEQTIRPTFNPLDDRNIIEDRPGPSKPTPVPAPVPTPVQPASVSAPTEDVAMKDPKPKADHEKRQPRKSDLQTLVDPKIMLDRVLRAPITVAIGELLAVSKEMTSQFQDVIKFKSAKHDRDTEARPHVRLAEIEPSPSSETLPTAITAAAFAPRSRGQLIQIPLECYGERILAIVDTGSQLNIVNHSIWKNRVARPMDITRRLVMNDASGGESMLEGLVSDVPLTCGGVHTTANIYVGPKAPFDLLLGRPWQRGNFVSIDERIDGTYLLFKDKNLQVNFEMLVTPDHEIDPRVIEYINSAHTAVDPNAVKRRVKTYYTTGKSSDIFTDRIVEEPDSHEEDQQDIFSMTAEYEEAATQLRQRQTTHWYPLPSPTTSIPIQSTLEEEENPEESLHEFSMPGSWPEATPTPMYRKNSLEVQALWTLISLLSLLWWSISTLAGLFYQALQLGAQGMESVPLTLLPVSWYAAVVEERPPEREREREVHERPAERAHGSSEERPLKRTRASRAKQRSDEPKPEPEDSKRLEHAHGLGEVEGRGTVSETTSAGPKGKERATEMAEDAEADDYPYLDEDAHQSDSEDDVAEPARRRLRDRARRRVARKHKRHLLDTLNSISRYHARRRRHYRPSNRIPFEWIPEHEEKHWAWKEYERELRQLDRRSTEELLRLAEEVSPPSSVSDTEHETTIDSGDLQGPETSIPDTPGAGPSGPAPKAHPERGRSTTSRPLLRQRALDEEEMLAAQPSSRGDEKREEEPEERAQARSPDEAGDVTKVRDLGSRHTDDKVKYENSPRASAPGTSRNESNDSIPKVYAVHGRLVKQRDQTHQHHGQGMRMNEHEGKHARADETSRMRARRPHRARQAIPETARRIERALDLEDTRIARAAEIPTERPTPSPPATRPNDLAATARWGCEPNERRADSMTTRGRGERQYRGVEDFFDEILAHLSDEVRRSSHHPQSHRLTAAGRHRPPGTSATRQVRPTPAAIDTRPAPRARAPRHTPHPLEPAARPRRENTTHATTDELSGGKHCKTSTVEQSARAARLPGAPLSSIGANGSKSKSAQTEREKRTTGLPPPSARLDNFANRRPATLAIQDDRGCPCKSASPPCPAARPQAWHSHDTGLARQRYKSSTAGATSPSNAVPTRLRSPRDFPHAVSSRLRTVCKPSTESPNSCPVRLDWVSPAIESSPNSSSAMPIKITQQFVRLAGEFFPDNPSKSLQTGFPGIFSADGSVVNFRLPKLTPDEARQLLEGGPFARGALSKQGPLLIATAEHLDKYGPPSVLPQPSYEYPPVQYYQSIDAVLVHTNDGTNPFESKTPSKVFDLPPRNDAERGKRGELVLCGRVRIWRAPDGLNSGREAVLLTKSNSRISLLQSLPPLTIDQWKQWFHDHGFATFVLNEVYHHLRDCAAFQDEDDEPYLAALDDKDKDVADAVEEEGLKEDESHDDESLGRVVVSTKGKGKKPAKYAFSPTLPDVVDTQMARRSNGPLADAPADPSHRDVSPSMPALVDINGAKTNACNEDEDEDFMSVLASSESLLSAPTSPVLDYPMTDDPRSPSPLVLDDGHDSAPATFREQPEAVSTPSTTLSTQPSAPSSPAEPRTPNDEHAIELSTGLAQATVNESATTFDGDHMSKLEMLARISELVRNGDEMVKRMNENETLKHLFPHVNISSFPDRQPRPSAYTTPLAPSTSAPTPVNTPAQQDSELVDTNEHEEVATKRASRPRRARRGRKTKSSTSSAAAVSDDDFFPDIEPYDYPLDLRSLPSFRSTQQPTAVYKPAPIAPRVLAHGGAVNALRVPRTAAHSMPPMGSLQPPSMSLAGGDVIRTASSSVRPLGVPLAVHYAVPAPPTTPFPHEQPMLSFHGNSVVRTMQAPAMLTMGMHPSDAMSLSATVASRVPHAPSMVVPSNGLSSQPLPPAQPNIYVPPARRGTTTMLVPRPRPLATRYDNLVTEAARRRAQDMDLAMRELVTALCRGLSVYLARIQAEGPEVNRWRWEQCFKYSSPLSGSPFLHPFELQAVYRCRWFWQARSENPFFAYDREFCSQRIQSLDRILATRMPPHDQFIRAMRDQGRLDPSLVPPPGHGPN